MDDDEYVYEQGPMTVDDCTPSSEEGPYLEFTIVDEVTQLDVGDVRMLHAALTRWLATYPPEADNEEQPEED